ncbi:Cold shock domain-containing protein [Echinococcus granulosus]|uniref:Cold shock domain-containing protein n=1 Tax=Echinococcus granulosus TaxID=6210 RepID=U6J3C8_ECHGR|nr:Cold shock domain-containing protein [Echinococcus granulosus]EUB62363.1 Cold shock domain-containing protein [Echinococcus granulosus]KAH9281364.1 Cold shock domain-containing protein [Echinococcus granulosus]CDS18509.1 Cold shock protein DNA binding [Echinococcus granulosus]
MFESGEPSSPLPSIPSPIIHKRNRTFSQSARAAEATEEGGVITSFCREKGHGFIKADNGELLFVHVFDIDGEVVPLAGDRVLFKKILIPPKNEKYQAVHVKIVDFVPERHQRWQELPCQ